MTDNEIIKALEAILNREYPKDTVVPTAIATIEFFKGVSNIIDGMRNDICYLEDKIDTINYEKNGIINRQKAEIVQLKQNLEEAHIDIKEHMAEIEKLQEVIFKKEDLMQLFHEEHQKTVDELQNIKSVLEEIENDINPLPFVTDFDVAIRNAKSEAIKEFAERLKLRFSGTLSCSGGAIARAVDKLVKEMTEQKG